MNKKIVVFDFDGVVVNTFEIYASISRELNPEINLSDKKLRSFFEGSVLDAPIFKNSKLNLFSKKYKPKLLQLPTVTKIKQAIKTLARDHTLIIVSSANSLIIKKYLKKQGLLEQFDSVLGADIERSKVKKFKTLLKKYKVNLNEIIFITDTLGDIIEARKAGVKSIAVTWGYHTKATLGKSNPHKIITKPSKLIESIKNYFQT
jgi:phosphoglycolate phosphatase